MIGNPLPFVPCQVQASHKYTNMLAWSLSYILPDATRAIARVPVLLGYSIYANHSIEVQQVQLQSTEFHFMTTHVNSLYIRHKQQMYYTAVKYNNVHGSKAFMSL